MSIFINKITKNNKNFDITLKIDKSTFKIKISEDLLIEERLFKEGEITKEKYDSLMSKLPKDSLFIDSIKYLEKNMKSEKELKDYLLRKTSSMSLIDSVIESLKSKNILNDELYFERVIYELIYIKRYGHLKIYDELKERGIDMDFEYPIETLKENINYHIIKYTEKNKDYPYKKLIYSTKNYLLVKGFSENTINEYFNYSLIKSNDEEALFNKELNKLKEKCDDINKIKQSLYKKGFSEELINKL